MGMNKRGVRDGSGPYRGSWQRRVHGSKGRRRQAGKPCPERKRKG